MNSIVEQVEVVRIDGLLEVRLMCSNRPGVLVDVMEAVESRGLTIVQARIKCHNDIVFQKLRLEVRTWLSGGRVVDPVTSSRNSFNYDEFEVYLFQNYFVLLFWRYGEDIETFDIGRRIRQHTAIR